MTVTSSNILDAVRSYRELGLNVLPVKRGTKRPAVPWERWQTEFVPDDRLGPMFYRQTGVCVVLGPISGGLGCRDFDAQDSFDSWVVDHSDLGNFLPIAKTARGGHVYFKTTGEGIHDQGDGELRLSRGIMLLPPTIHPSGTRYEWLTPPTPDNLVYLDDLAGAGLDNSGYRESTECNTDDTEAQTPQSPQDIQDVRGGCSVPEDVFRKTMPTGPGTRQRKLFLFVRHLRSMPEYEDCRPESLEKVVREWHRRALPTIRTKAFCETWLDFLRAWPKVRTLIGEDLMQKMLERALRRRPPARAIELYPDHRELQLLAALCRELQTAAGDGTFFLSCRTAAELLGRSHVDANRWLWLLIHDGFLREVEKGGKGKMARKATEYRYVGGDA